MATLSVLEFDPEGRPIPFETWLDELFLLSDSRDSVSLFDHTSGASLAPPDTADSATRSQWLTRDAAARLAVRNHLPLAERAHFGQHKTAKALYDAVVARYSSPAIVALGCLILPYLFPELSSFATVVNLITHLRTSDTRYRAALKAEDHFLTLDPTDLTVDLLEERLLAAETSIVAVGAARGTLARPSLRSAPPPPLPPLLLLLLLSTSLVLRRSALLLLLVGSAAAARAREARVVEVAAGWGGGGGAGGGGGGGGSGGGSGGGGGGGGGSGGGGGGARGGSGSGGGGGGGGRSGGGGSGGGPAGAVQRQQQQRPRETLTPQQLREWFAQRGASGGSARCPYVIRTGDRAGQTCGKFHTQHRCFSRLDDAWRAEFGDEAELPRWAELRRSGVDIFALDYDAILAAMYALTATSPTLRWTGEVGDASVFRVWGSRAFVRDTSADKLSSRAIPCVFLGFPPDAPGWQFYHPTSRSVLSTQDVTFDESVPFYRLFPYRTAPLPPPPLFLAPGPPLVDPLLPQGPSLSGVSHVDPLPLAEPVEVTGDSGAAGGGPARGAEPGGAEPGGAEPEREEPGGAEPERVEPGGTESGGAEPRGAASAGGPTVELLGLKALPLETLELEALDLETLALWALEPEALGLEAQELEALTLEILELEVLAVLGLLVLEVLVLEALWSLSPHSSCSNGLLGAPAFGVALLELETLRLEALELEALELETLKLEPLELGALELEALELKALALEALELQALELEVPALEALALEVLELEALELHVLELEALALEALELEAL
ncbi:unnamed protein product [Closterium sp. Yama58-4]|nr:unnamed protein product [Closterium sp. Yama58-4]